MNNKLERKIMAQRHLINHLYQWYTDAQKELNKLVNKLQDECEHEYVRDEHSYDPCRTLYVCEKCGKPR